jgi:hypothetical protein
LIKILGLDKPVSFFGLLKPVSFLGLDRPVNFFGLDRATALGLARWGALGLCRRADGAAMLAFAAVSLVAARLPELERSLVVDFAAGLPISDFFVIAIVVSPEILDLNSFLRNTLLQTSCQTLRQPK